MLEKLAAKRQKSGSHEESNPIYKDDDLQLMLEGWYMPWETKYYQVPVEKPKKQIEDEGELSKEIPVVHIPF